ncbi:hypothetical protein KH5_21670 [Urechidicola sp. KH5]
MKTTTKITAFLVLLISTTSCMFDGFGIQGNRNVVTEDRKISAEFEGIKTSEGITVYLTQDSEVDLTVEADENIIDLLVTEVKDDILVIHFEKNVSRAKARNVYVKAPKINSLKATSGAHIKSENTIDAKNLRISSTSGASMNIEIEAENVNCSSSSGADINVKGAATNFDGSASSGSHINARNLETEISDVGASSGAGIRVNVSEELTASASSGGSISYDGSPKVLNKSKSSGGSISGH